MKKLSPRLPLTWGGTFFNEKLLRIIKDRSVSGAICDLGCGSASTLKYLCRKSKLPGLGFDFSSSSIEAAKRTLRKNDRITLLAKDIANIDEIYPDVEILIQSFVMHDFQNNPCKAILRSILKSFPNAKTFLYVDAVSPDCTTRCQLPGFDYIHGLFGIKPRTLEETLSFFAEAKFHILDQEPITGLNNCYIWTLQLDR